MNPPRSPLAALAVLAALAPVADGQGDPSSAPGISIKGGGSLDSPFATLRELHDHLESEATAGRFSGVVLATDGYEPVFHEAYGLASKGFGVPNRPDTRFNIGSIGKQITAIAVLQLWHAGALDLDDPIGEHLQGFPPEVATAVTLRSLLQHRSGWGDYRSDERYRQDWYDLRTVDDYLPILRTLPLEFEPGTDRLYSNAGYLVLGAVVEAVSGASYDEYVAEHVYGPAGMEHTGPIAVDEIAPNSAVGYTDMVGQAKGYRRRNTALLSARGTPAGGSYSTAEDLLSLLRALRQGTLLPVPYVDYLMQARFEGPLPDPDQPGYTRVWTGGAPGVSAAMGGLAGGVYVVLSNYDPPVAMEVHDTLVMTALRERLAKSDD